MVRMSRAPSRSPDISPATIEMDGTGAGVVPGARVSPDDEMDCTRDGETPGATVGPGNAVTGARTVSGPGAAVDPDAMMAVLVTAGPGARCRDSTQQESR